MKDIQIHRNVFVGQKFKLHGSETFKSRFSVVSIVVNNILFFFFNGDGDNNGIRPHKEKVEDTPPDLEAFLRDEAKYFTEQLKVFYLFSVLTHAKSDEMLAAFESKCGKNLLTDSGENFTPEEMKVLLSNYEEITGQKLESHVIINLEGLRFACSSIYGILSSFYDGLDTKPLFTLPEDVAKFKSTYNKLKTLFIKKSHIGISYEDVITQTKASVFLVNILNQERPQNTDENGENNIPPTPTQDILRMAMNEDRVGENVKRTCAVLENMYHGGEFAFKDGILLLTNQIFHVVSYLHMAEFLAKHKVYSEIPSPGRLNHEQLKYTNHEISNNIRDHGFDSKSTGIFIIRCVELEKEIQIIFDDFGESSMSSYSGGHGLGHATIKTSLQEVFGGTLRSEVGIYDPLYDGEYGSEVFARAQALCKAFSIDTTKLIKLGTGYRLTISIPRLN